MLNKGDIIMDKEEFKVGDYAVLEDKFIVRILDIFDDCGVTYVKVKLANDGPFNIFREVPITKLSEDIR